VMHGHPSTLYANVELMRLHTQAVVHGAAAELYPNGYRFRVEPDTSAEAMEAVCRPGFLQGVLTIVMKLLNLVRADRAYFGEKDYEQLETVTGMVDEFFLPTQIVPCPTVREKSGLAMSSRNMLLSPDARDRAAFLFRALTTASSPEEARDMLQAQGFVVEYVEERWGRRLAAVFLGGVRLIDNVPLGG
jgi:pantoate--beta-alanine ligase